MTKTANFDRVRTLAEVLASECGRAANEIIALVDDLPKSQKPVKLALTALADRLDSLGATLSVELRVGPDTGCLARLMKYGRDSLAAGVTIVLAVVGTGALEEVGSLAVHQILNERVPEVSLAIEDLDKAIEEHSQPSAEADLLGNPMMKFMLREGFEYSSILGAITDADSVNHFQWLLANEAPDEHAVFDLYKVLGEATGQVENVNLDQLNELRAQLGLAPFSDEAPVHPDHWRPGTE